MDKKIRKYIKKEMSEFTEEAFGGNKAKITKLLIDLAIKNNHSKKEASGMIEDSLWYSYEDFMRIHNKEEKNGIR